METVCFRTILPSWLATGALWCGSGQHGFDSEHIAIQEASVFSEITV